MQKRGGPSFDEGEKSRRVVRPSLKFKEVIIMVHNTNGSIVHMQGWGGQRAFEGGDVSLAHGHISQWACSCVLSL